MKLKYTYTTTADTVEVRLSGPGGEHVASAQISWPNDTYTVPFMDGFGIDSEYQGSGIVYVLLYLLLNKAVKRGHQHVRCNNAHFGGMSGSLVNCGFTEIGGTARRDPRYKKNLRDTDNTNTADYETTTASTAAMLAGQKMSDKQHQVSKGGGFSICCCFN